MFDAKKEKEHIIEWIRNWFSENGPNANAVVGISGGKDSTIVAALLAEALGRERVYGVLMPQDVQPDLDDAKKVVETLGINTLMVNVGEPVQKLKEQLLAAVNPLEDSAEQYKKEGSSIDSGKSFGMESSNNNGQTGRIITELSSDTIINIPPRIRMATLYAVAASLPGGGRVANTCNRSEDYIGYSTKYGDAAGDFSPISDYLVTEVKQIGHELEALAPISELIEKTPSDGLCGYTDEDKIGFTYATLDKYILTGVCEDEGIKHKIDRMHVLNLHKLKTIPMCKKLM
ncbi:MAG: NAD(+) synthase [Lachnospiraceae bacterium]|nr:NAD(+) synthase [Lachnospiraceae bacterium]